MSRMISVGLMVENLAEALGLSKESRRYLLPFGASPEQQRWKEATVNETTLDIPYFGHLPVFAPVDETLEREAPVQVSMEQEAPAMEFQSKVLERITTAAHDKGFSAQPRALPTDSNLVILDLVPGGAVKVERRRS